MKCNFCGIKIHPGTGLMFVQKDGKVINFCGRKCEKNLLHLKRKPRQTRWTEEFHKIKKGVKQ